MKVKLIPESIVEVGSAFGNRTRLSVWPESFESANSINIEHGLTFFLLRVVCLKHEIVL